MQHSGYGSDKLRLLPMLTNSALYWTGDLSRKSEKDDSKSFNRFIRNNK